MPRNVLEFRVVVASPSDVFDTRKAVFEVIDELNRVFEVQKISIKGLGWEEFVTPGVGHEPQSVINEQLLKEYDILVALFATKLGSPTLTAASGTVEEIENAIANLESPMGKYRVQVYFREKIDRISDVSIDDLAKVVSYKEKLKQSGILYGTFHDRNDLQREIRVNLQRPILDYLKNQGPTNSAVAETELQESDSKQGATRVVANDEFGLLDHTETAEVAIEVTNRAMVRIAQLIGEIQEETNQQVETIEASSFVGASTSEKKRVMNRFAMFLTGKATELRQEVTLANESFSTFADAVVLLAGADPQRGSEQYRQAVASFLRISEEMLKNIGESRLSMLGFKAAVESVPRITIQFNQAKRLLIQAIDQCLEFFDNAEQKIYEMTAGT